jgi:hypothetical protein
LRSVARRKSAFEGIELDPLAVGDGLGHVGLAVALEDRPQESIALVVVCLQGDVTGRRLVLVSRRQDQVLPSLALVQAGWSHVLDGRLPAIVDRTGDGASVRRWDFEHDWTDVLRVEEGHEVDGVGVGSKGLILPVEQARPIDDLVATLAGLGVVDHGLVHAVEVHGGCASDDGLNGTALDHALSDIPGRGRGGSRLSLNLISILAAYEVNREDQSEDKTR